MIKYIDLQLTSWCNRSCSFCPPQSKFRSKNITTMTDDKYNDVLNLIQDGLDCGKIDNKAKISISRYFEPLSNIDLVSRRIKPLAEKFPNSEIFMHSNGDYLSKEIVSKIPSEFNRVIVNYYEKAYFDVVIIVYELFGNVIKDTNMEVNTITFTHNNIEWMFIWNKEEIMDFKNRGSVMTNIYNKDRTCECKIPNNSLVFDADGTIMPCCDMYSKVPSHKDGILGNPSTHSFNDIYEKLENFNYKNFNACKKCNAKYETIFGK